MGTHVTIGTTGQFAEGSLQKVVVDGRELAVGRLGDGFFAVDDTCTHRGCSLSEGELEGATVVCPCHGGTYELATGAVLAGPPPAPIGVYPVRVQGDQLQVEL